MSHHRRSQCRIMVPQRKLERGHGPQIDISDRHLRASKEAINGNQWHSMTIKGDRTCMDLCEAESIQRGTRSPGAVVGACSSGS